MAPSTNKKWQRSVYLPVAGSMWEDVESNSYRNTIMMPMKGFHGAVGEFERIKYDCSRILLQRWALWPLMVEAVARHHFKSGRNNSFPCPSLGCNAHFTKTVEWTAHAAESHSREWQQSDILPGKTRAVFQKRAGVLEKISKGFGRRHEKIKEEWNEEGGKMEKEIKRG
jgi:hypothetical protein